MDGIDGARAWALGALALALALGGCVARDLGELADAAEADAGAGSDASSEPAECPADATIDVLPFARAWLDAEAVHIHVDSAEQGCDSRLGFVAPGQTRISLQVDATDLEGGAVDLASAHAVALIMPGGPGAAFEVGEIRYLQGQVTLHETDDGELVGRIDELGGRLSGCFVATVCE